MYLRRIGQEKKTECAKKFAWQKSGKCILTLVKFKIVVS